MIARTLDRVLCVASTARADGIDTGKLLPQTLRLDRSFTEIVNPERSLAAVVLLQALYDARSKPVRRRKAGVQANDVEQARLFLMSRTGGWARARDAWCDHAGIDPAAFGDWVADLLLLTDEPE